MQELKLFGADEPLKMPEPDRLQLELKAWKQLALARGALLDPFTINGSREYSLAVLDAKEAIRILYDLNAAKINDREK